MHNPSSRLNDLNLIRNAQAGSQSAFAELISLYDRSALRLALHLTGSETEAQDICQEAFLRAYQNIGRFRLESCFYTWLYRIVSNLCLDWLRKKQAHKQRVFVAFDSDGEEHDILEHLPDSRPAANPERELLRQELGKRIRVSLKRLSPRERMIFELRHFHGLRLAAIGEILSTRESAVKTSLFRATRKMRNALSSERRSRLLSHSARVAPSACADRLEACTN